MSDSSVVSPDAPVSESSSSQLPISSIVRAVCQAASGGPDMLYEVMIKMSLMVEATAPTYGLSIWATSDSGKPTLRWAEGLRNRRSPTGERAVAEIFASKGRPNRRGRRSRNLSLACAAFAGPRRCGTVWSLCATINRATGKRTQRAQRRRAPGPLTPVYKRHPDRDQTRERVFNEFIAGDGIQ